MTYEEFKSIIRPRKGTTEGTIKSWYKWCRIGTVGVMPTIPPTGTFIFLKYLYGKNEVLPKMQKNQTPEMKIKTQYHHNHKHKVSKVQLRLNNWNANPGKK